MCYHQVGQGNAMAVALDDDLNHWKKLPSNPITPETIPGDQYHGLYRSWDPYGWMEDGTYYAIFGGERPAIAKSDTGRSLAVLRRLDGQRSPRIHQRRRLLRRLLQARGQAHAPVHQPPPGLPLLPWRLEERAIWSEFTSK